MNFEVTMTETYNGWTNWETWNVALWIDNDEGLYRLALKCHSYKRFVEYMHAEGLIDCQDGKANLIYYQTPDGVSWNDSGLDIEALDKMITELRD